MIIVLHRKISSDRNVGVMPSSWVKNKVMAYQLLIRIFTKKGERSMVLLMTYENRVSCQHTTDHNPWKNIQFTPQIMITEIDNRVDSHILEPRTYGKKFPFNLIDFLCFSTISRSNIRFNWHSSVLSGPLSRVWANPMSAQNFINWSRVSGAIEQCFLTEFA